MSSYTYPVTATASSAANVVQLQREIEESGAITSVCLGVTLVDATTLVIDFDNPLGGEQASLDAVVAAHVPAAHAAGPVIVTDANLLFDAEGRLVYDGEGRLLLASD